MCVYIYIDICTSAKTCSSVRDSPTRPSRCAFVNIMHIYVYILFVMCIYKDRCLYIYTVCEDMRKRKGLTYTPEQVCVIFMYMYMYNI